MARNAGKELRVLNVDHYDHLASKMKQHQISDKDLKQIQNIQNHNATYQFLKNKNQFNFTAGDFLIKLNKRGDKWEVENVSSVSQVPKRYLCVYEDEFGIKYIRQLTSKGDVLPHITPLTEWSNWTRYEIDPEFAEHIILNGEEEFDFAAQKRKEKSRRDRITRKNKKLVVAFKDMEAVDNFIKCKQPGDFLWIGYTIPDAANSKFEVLDIAESKEVFSWNGERSTTFSIRVKNVANQHTHNISSEELFRSIVIDVEPHPYAVI